MSSYNLKPDAPVDTRYKGFWESFKLWNTYSQNGEDAIIEAIFARIGTANKWCFECGAADGLFFSNTKRLIDQGWNAILIECDKSDCERLHQIHDGNEKVKIIETFIVSEMPYHVGTARQFHKWTLDGILKRGNAPKDLDLLVLDIDSQEYYILNSMIEFQPRVVIVEYNSDADPMFIPDLNGPGQAGHLAMRYVAEARGYEVIGRTPTNLICVRKDLAPMLMESQAQWEQGLRQAQAEVKALAALVNTENARKCDCDPAIEQCGFCANELAKPVPTATEAPKRYQIFAAGRWQDADAEEIEVFEHEQADAKADKLPIRALEVEKRRVQVAAAMSMPSLTHTASMLCVNEATWALGMPLFTGHGCFWHHGLTRSIQHALNYRDKDGNPADFIVTIDFDSIFTAETVKQLVVLLGQHPEVDAIVPMQQKREGGELLAGTREGVNLTLPLVPILTGHFGLTIFRREVFDKLPKPWFVEKPSPQGDWGEGRRDPDITFWDQFIAVGLQARLATQVSIGHKQEMITWPKLLPDGTVEAVNQYGSQWQKTKSAPVTI